jgi:uncharacterized Zn-binding protein involved in type VI secretion
MKVFNKATKNSCVGLLTGLALIVASHANAENLPAPVSGLEILDLAGTAIPANGVIDNYSADFTATTAASTITAVFRHDPGFFTLNNVVVTDVTHPGPNLIVNGNFLTGAPTAPGAGVPSWTYFTQAGNDYPQYLGYELAGGGFYDGSTQAYDGIDQTFGTTAGDVYSVTFTLSQTGASNVGATTYQQLSTNGDTTDTGGNGIDMVLYAGNGLPPTTVPDQSSTFVLLLSSLGLMAFWKMRTLGQTVS